MIERRRGFRMFNNELKFQVKLFRDGYIGGLQFVFIGVPRSLIRLLPAELLGGVYKAF